MTSHFNKLEWVLSKFLGVETGNEDSDLLKR